MLLTVLILILQLRIDKSYEQYSLLDNLSRRTFELNYTSSVTNQTNATVETVFLSFHDIKWQSLIGIWVNSTLLPALYEDENKTFYKQNYIVGEPMLVLLVRIVKEHNNKNTQTNTVFPHYSSRHTFHFDQKIGDEAFTDDITLDDGTVVSYSNEHDDTQFNGLGGYYLHYPRNTTEALSLNYTEDK